MFVYLSKRIAVPNNLNLSAISWSNEDGWIGCAGEKGLLKVLKLSDSKNDQQSQGGLSLNNSLEGHSGTTNIVIWNDQYKKLTTADSNGLIIVWMIQNKQWIEEMINNRNKSQVVDMKWSPDGTKICITYMDGAVILGGVEGARLWGKEFKHQLQLIEWSPDGKLMLFGTVQGQVWVYDNEGIQIHQINIYCLQKIIPDNQMQNPNQPLARIEWYKQSKMHTEDTPPGLIIAYQCGRIQLMKNDTDDDPILIDTLLKIFQVQWNPTGTIFVICGQNLEGSEKKGTIQFYNNQGIHLKNIRVPGSELVSSISWEGKGLRLAMAVGASIFFANIKPDHKWSWMNCGTIVFGYPKSNRVESSVVFWDTKNNQKNIKYLRNLIWIKSCGQFTCIVNKVDETEDQYQIVLSNSIGSSIDQKTINIEPISCSMSSNHVIICSHSDVYVWQYRNQTARLTTFQEIQGGSKQQSQIDSNNRRIGRENAWFIDEQPNPHQIYDKDNYSKDKKTADPIISIASSEGFFMVARKSGDIHVYSLPHIHLENKQVVKESPSNIFMNCDATRFACIDINGHLTIWDINNQGGTQLDFDKKDVWHVQWADDQPQCFVFMEKSRLYTVKNTQPEEPIQTEGYVCQFNNLQIKCAFIDDIMKTPDGNLKTSQFIVEFDTRSLRDTNDIIQKVNMKEALAFVEENPHPRLWRLIVEKSLEELDFNTSEKALIKVGDYLSLQMVRRLQLIDDKNKQKAEILAYHGKVDEAEQLLKKIERKDLAIQLRSRLGDWFKVAQMVKEGTGFDDVLQNAYNQLGYHYADRFKWSKAAHYFQMAKNYEDLAEAYYKAEDFENLEKLIRFIPEGKEQLLINIGEKCELTGLCESAVQCYERAGKIKLAIDCAVLLNQWHLAVDLAERHGLPQVEGLLSQYANQQLAQNRKLEAAELYRRAQRNTEAAKILSSIGNDLVQQEASPLTIKKLHVMAALEVESHKKRVFDATMTGQQTGTAKTLDSLITSDINTGADKLLNNPWRGAEAWHFYIMAQRQLYQQNYQYALHTAIRLSEYELELGTKKVYSIIALAGYYSGNYQECSRAFVKLEAMEDISEIDKQNIQELAVQIFSKNQPDQQSQLELFKCPGQKGQCNNQVTELETHCKVCGSNFQGCVASGRPIIAKVYYTCKSCRHKMIESEIDRAGLKNCALCHVPIVENKK